MVSAAALSRRSCLAGGLALLCGCGAEGMPGASLLAAV